VNLFNENEGKKELNNKQTPLAFRMRPRNLEEFVGQKHILAKGKLLWRAIKADRISSLILYGPPGTGKTALAFVMSQITSSYFVSINAVTSGVETLKRVIQAAGERQRIDGKRTILFIDEIHRFNKTQQNILAPVLERGELTLIGATTFNPFHSLISPLISRSLIFEFKKLSKQDILKILRRALQDEKRGLGNLPIEVENEALNVIATLCDGDARKSLTALEVACLTTPKNKEGLVVIDKNTALESIQKKEVIYDRLGDEHYDTISAFIKSLRGSDPDAAIYWLAKMLYAGEDPLFIARRMVIFASEDIGNADPQALVVAMACYGAVEVVGLPEAEINLAQATCYLATAPKSNASYVALNETKEDIQKERTQEIPQYLKDTSYYGAKRLGRGKGYIYPHSQPHKKQVYLRKHKKYYRPDKKV
jgi:putative ATPase